MTESLEEWLEKSPDAKYFRELRAILDRMPLDFDVKARSQINAAFQKASNKARSASEHKQHPNN